MAAERWVVLKFGGTSVAGKPQWETIASLAQQRRADGLQVLLVCSAVAGVTNLLEALAAKPDSVDLLERTLDRHRVLGRDLGVDENAWLPEAEQKIQDGLANQRREPGPRFRAALLAMGEWLSTRIGGCFLQTKFATVWVDARDALEAIDEKDLSPARRWLSAACLPGADAVLATRWAGRGPVLITQGFVARTHDKETALLGRGGSDTSAALLAGRLSAVRVEIWTDVPGLFSADPRLIADARLLTEVDYAEALEMAASGATVVHPRCIRAAAATRTPVEIYDLNRRSLPGTRIGDRRSNQPGIKTVTCQRHMAVFLLQNLDTRYEVGFLAGVFDIFRRHGVSVDLVATSETTTTVAVNCKANHLEGEQLESLTQDLGSRCKVELFDNSVCINLVGHGARTALSKLQNVMQFFDDHALLMVSQSANDLCFSLLVHHAEHEALLRAAHSALIPAAGGNSGGVFGDRWLDIHQGETGAS